eukprot:300863-Pyramimonas_sp.AAC.1
MAEAASSAASKAPAAEETQGFKIRERIPVVTYRSDDLPWNYQKDVMVEYEVVQKQRSSAICSSA